MNLPQKKAENRQKRLTVAAAEVESEGYGDWCRIEDTISFARKLNIHKIGIQAPASYVFDELLEWNGDSTCWPNHIAKVDRIENDLGNIRILPFGWKKYPFRMNSLLGIKLIPLFLLNAIEISTTEAT